MAGYNNYGNYGNYANYPAQGQYAGIGSMNTIPQQTNNFGYQNTYQQNQMPVQDNRFQFVDYVSGRAGADAYQLPTGVTRALLFDNDTNRFYVKTYDNNGRPRVVEDNDFQTHGNQMRNPMNGRYMGRGSGTYYPPYMDNRYYDDMGSSGRRYYDDEKKNALHKLHHMMDMEENR